MLNITKTLDGNTLTVALEGRLTTAASQELEGELRAALTGVTELIFDLEKLTYITSAGLRLLLSCQKVMNRQGSMRIRNADPEIMKIFEMVGFAGLMNFE